MSSPGDADRLDFDRDLPTTPADVRALRAARVAPAIGFAAYLAFLAGFPPAPGDKLRARRGPRGDSFFELP